MAIAMTAGGAAAAVLVASAGANLPIGVNNSQPIHGFLPVDLGFQEHVKERYQILQEKQFLQGNFFEVDDGQKESLDCFAGGATKRGDPNF
jgi:hypothetical protein